MEIPLNTVGDYHWIIVCGGNETEIIAYDSLNKASGKQIFLHQISDMVKTLTGKIKANRRPVQRKQNGVD